jgi:hypothetical protein
MAYISQDPNQNQETNTTNVLAPTATSTNQPTTADSNNTAQVATSAPAAGYVSNGNPYGKYGASGQQAPSGTSASSRKSNSGPSSGLQTNVQTYAEKNQASSQGLGSAVANKLQTSSDLAKQNLSKIEQKFGQGVEAGSLANRENAVTDVKTAATEASTLAGPERTFTDRSAALYNPTKTSEGAYSAEDQALVDANKARVKYADGSIKDFADAATAQDEIDNVNKANPGYFTYGEDAKLSIGNDRLSEILNAKYQGPQELSQIAGFDSAYNKIQDAGALQQQALGGSPKEELLKRTFDTPTGEYTKGSRLLDDLLLGQGKAADTLKSTAEKLGSTESGKLSDEFTSRVKDARGQAAQRSNEIDNVKTSARQALTDTSAGRDKEVNQRIEGVIKDWDKYPKYFKDRFQGELDKHNDSSTKHNQYMNVANKYGSYEAAVAQKQNIQQTYPDLENFNLQNLIGDNVHLTQGSIMDWDKTPQQMEELRKQITQRVSQQRVTFDNLIKSQGANPDQILSYLSTPPSGGGSERRAHERAISSYTNTIPKQIDQLKSQVSNIGTDLVEMDKFKDFKNYDPTSLNVGLSQLESETLGVQGGEGLYNILKEQGVDGLIKTAAYDKNKLVSSDEQSQLARLQSMAELAKDYGVSGSGVNVINRYGDRDLAGQQNATSALDLDNFKNQLQSAERGFRTDAAASNISGTGSGTGSSGGWFGTKRSSATKSVNQNFGDLLAQNNAYRNMYSDKGVNKDLLKTASDLARGNQTFGVTDAATGIDDSIQSVQDIIGTKSLGKAGSIAANTVLAPITIPLQIAKMLGTAIGGSSADASSEANRNAQAAAVADLQRNIQNKIQSTGLKNQLSVNQNNQQDMELFKLLGLLDTTNL